MAGQLPKNQRAPQSAGGGFDGGPLFLRGGRHQKPGVRRAIGPGEQIGYRGGLGLATGRYGCPVLLLDLAGVDQRGEQLGGGLVRRVRDAEQLPAHLALEELLGRTTKLEPAPFQGGEEVEVRLGIGLRAGQVEGQGGELDPVVQAKAGLGGGPQQRLFRLAQLSRVHQHVNVIGGEVRQALVIAQDEEIDPRLLPRAKDGGDQLADFWLARTLSKGAPRPGPNPIRGLPERAGGRNRFRRKQ